MMVFVIKSLNFKLILMMVGGNFNQSNSVSYTRLHAIIKEPSLCDAGQLFPRNVNYQPIITMHKDIVLDFKCILSMKL